MNASVCTRHAPASIPISAARQDLLARRQPDELGLEKFEIGFDRSEVGASLIDLTQRERVLVGHVHVMPEDG